MSEHDRVYFGVHRQVFERGAFDFVLIYGRRLQRK